MPIFSKSFSSVNLSFPFPRRCDDESSSSNSSPTPRKFRSKLAPLAFGFLADGSSEDDGESLYFRLSRGGGGSEIHLVGKGGEDTFLLILFCWCSTLEEYPNIFCFPTYYSFFKSLVG